LIACFPKRVRCLPQRAHHDGGARQRQGDYQRHRVSFPKRTFEQRQQETPRLSLLDGAPPGNSSRQASSTTSANFGRVDTFASAVFPRLASRNIRANDKPAFRLS
jgi:hypothetical protein